MVGRGGCCRWRGRLQPLKMKTFAAILLTALLFGRPSQCSHEQALIKAAANMANLSRANGLFDAGAGYILGQHLEVTDYYLFSVGTIKGQVVSVGALKYIYVRQHLLTLKLLRL